MARPPKKAPSGAGGSARGEQIAPEAYNDFDDAIDAGVEAEEKAERFAVGIKARRHFERSLSLYRRSLQLNPRSADAAYNCARVCFLLGTAFYQPRTSTSILRDSVRLYQQALSLSPPTETASDGNTLPNAFYLDVQFNLGAAYMALGDQVDEAPGSTGGDDGNERVNLIRQAIACFEAVIQGQEMVLARQRVDEEEAIRQSAETDAESPRQEQDEQWQDQAMSNGDGESNGEQEGEEQYTTSLITPASAMETLHNIHMASLALLDASPLSPQSVEAAATISLHAQARAQQLSTAYPDGEKRSPDGEWAEGLAQMQYAPLAIKVAQAAKHAEIAGTQSWPEAGAEEAALTALEQEALSSINAVLSEAQAPIDVSSTAGRLQQRLRTGHLEELGDCCLSLARIRIRYLDLLALQPGGAAGEGIKSIATRSWNFLARSSKAFLAALASLDTQAGAQAGSAVLGSANTSTTTSRARLTLYTSLGVTSLLRTHQAFAQLGFINPASLGTLLDNARVYARKGLTEVGLGWMLSYKATAVERQKANSHPFPHGGVESLRSEAEAILTLLRALFSRQQEGAVFKTTTVDSAAEVGSLCAALRELVRRPDTAESGGTPWSVVLLGSTTEAQGARTPLVDQILGEEGDVALSDAERQFWNGVHRSVFLVE